MESGPDFCVHKNVLNIPEGLLCELKTYLPEGYRTLVTSFNELPSCIYEFVLRLNIRSKEEALKWLACYKEKSLTSWNIYSTFKNSDEVVVFKINFLCHHNTRAKEGTTPSMKHTNCPAKLNITVKCVNEKSRSTDVHLKERPCEILLGVSHNHSINSAAALKYRKPSKRVVAIFEDLLLCKGHTPSSALKAYQLDLQLKHGDNYSQVADDGSICPNLRWVYHLHDKLIKNGSYDDLQPTASDKSECSTGRYEMREHNYAACKSRTRNAPHSISVCVDNNLLYSIENPDKNIQFL